MDIIFDAPWRALSNNNLGETGDEEVVWKSLDAASRQLSPLAAQWTRKLSIVGVLLVGRLGRDVTLYAVLAERVETREAFGTLVGFQTDLAYKEFVVDFLGQTSAERARRRHHEDFVAERFTSRWTTLHDIRQNILYFRNPIANLTY